MGLFSCCFGEDEEKTGSHPATPERRDSIDAVLGTHRTPVDTPHGYAPLAGGTPDSHHHSVAARGTPGTPIAPLQFSMVSRAPSPAAGITAGGEELEPALPHASGSSAGFGRTHALSVPTQTDIDSSFSKTLNVGSRPKTAGLLKFQDSNSFHKLAWHFLISGTSPEDAKNITAHLIQTMPSKYNVAALAESSGILALGQIVIHNLHGMIDGLFEARLDLSHILDKASKRIGKKTDKATIISLARFPEFVDSFYKTKPSSREEDYQNKLNVFTKNFVYILNSGFYCLAIKEAAEASAPDLNEFLPSCTSQSALEAHYRLNGNFNALKKAYHIMKCVRDVAKAAPEHPALAEIDGFWLMLPRDLGDRASIATKRTAGSVFTAETGERDVDDEEEDGNPHQVAGGATACWNDTTDGSVAGLPSPHELTGEVEEGFDTA